MEPAYVLGVGMTHFGRHPQLSVRDLAVAAVTEALADAGIGADQVGAVAFANAVQGAMEGQFGIRGQVALRDLPFDAVPIINVENACASATTALHLAMMLVRSGQTEIALAVGAEKMVHPDSASSMEAFEGSWDRADRANVIARLSRLGHDTPTPPAEAARETPHTVFMDVYGAFAKFHMARYGTTQRQLAVVAAKNHGHSVENPRSQYRRAFTVDEVLAARLIAWPMTLPMCSPISDGAAAAVVVSERIARQLGMARAARIRAAVPVNARLHPREIAYIASDAGARLAFATPDLAEGIARELPALPLILPETAAFAALTGHDPVAQAATAPTDTAWIFYTSGTTGRPKGALLSHRNLATMAIAYLADVDHLTPADSLLHLAATSHASGLFGLSFIAKAGANILPEAGGYDPAEMAGLIAANRSLSFFAPAMLLDRMAADPAIRAAPLDHVRTMLTGAGPIYVEDLRRWLAAFGPRIWNGYGQGESPCTITAISKADLWAAHTADDAARMGSVGIARTGISLRIARPDGSTADLGEVGEVLVQGDTVMSGYLNQPGASAEALRGGWLHTGDLARMDARGYLTLLDRKKDLIITGGMNVYAREVEEVLLAHPAVAECAVVGVRDTDWGESVMALIVPRGKDLDPQALDSFCLDRLARFKRPKQYRAMAEFPKNAAGKVLKAELRRMLAAQPPE